MKKNLQKVNKKAVCKCCNKKNDASIAVEDDVKPEEGDISVCYYCGAVSKYNKDLTLTLLSEKDLKNLKEEDPEAWITLDIVKNLLEGRNQNNNETSSKAISKRSQKVINNLETFDNNG